MSTAPLTTPQTVTLDGNWRLSQSTRHIDIDAHVPGVVQGDLLAAGKIPDPFYRDNETAVHWVGEVPWTYSRTFTVTPTFARRRHIILRCEGLDTLAHVMVNGKKLADTENMFRTWEFDVRPLLHAGVNKIAIAFDPVEPYLKAREHQAAFPDKPMSGWGYIRKAPFQGGWDFAPKIITCGIWRDISLVGWDDARLTDIGVNQRHHGGVVDLDVEVDANADKMTFAETSVSFHGKLVTKSTVPVVNGVGKSTLRVPHPQLWWPNGMGPQNLYEVRVRLATYTATPARDVPTPRGQLQRAGIILPWADYGRRTIGLRTVTWSQKTDKRPLTLAVNGRPFFAKGTNWVPCDALISRASAARERKFVDDAVDANMNLIRLWGGGYYEDDALFDECDKKGLMLWTEFKYADAAYPAFDPAWVANVKAETIDNVRRLRNHPCIAVWSGNNECIGFVADKTDSNHMTHEDYELLFHKLLPGVVHDLAPSAYYTPGSPEAGDDHDWSVWHGGAPFESYLDVHGFMSEFGYQSFPQPKTVDAYTNHDDRASVITDVMRFHQRNWGSGNQMILNGFNRYYHKPKDFDSTLWLSQIQQSDGVLTGVEHWRRDWPHSSGSLVWQYDDCWPTASWAMVDYVGRPKALWYRLRHAYAPVMLSGQLDKASGNADLWISNDRPHALRGVVDWALVRVDGSIVKKGSVEARITAGESSTHVLSLPCRDVVTAEGNGNVLLWATLRVSGEPLSKAVIEFTKPKFIALQDPGFKTTCLPKSGGVYAVTINATKPALRVWLDLAGVDARYSDNFVDVRPGEGVTIDITPAKKMSLASLRGLLHVRSLFDIGLPGGDPESNIVTAKLDGSIRATADQAEIEGNAAFVESPVAGTPPGTPGNIANWQNMGDYLQWTVKGAKPGTYSVTANVACPPGEEGSTFTVDVDGSVVTGTMPATKSWWDYVDISLGTVTISKSGTIMILLKPTSKPSTHVGNLRYLKLTPSGS